MPDSDSVFSSYEAEQAVIGAIISRSDMKSAIASGCNECWFHHNSCKQLWKVCNELYKGGVHIDNVTVCDYVKSKGLDMDLMFQMAKCLDACASPGKARYYIDIIREKWTKRKVDEIINEGRSMLEANNSDEVVSRMRYELSNIRPRVEDTRTIRDVTEELVERFTSSMGNGYSGLPSRWMALQQKLGGYKAGKVCIVAGRPKQGKSMFMVNEVSYIAKKDIPVGIVSLEMDRSEIIARMVGDIGGLDIFSYDSGDITPDDITDFKEISKKVHQLPVHITDRSMTIEQICSWIRDQKEENGVRMVAIDYIQLIASSHGHHRKSRNEEVAGWSHAIANVAKDTGVSIMLLSQLSRLGAVEPPKLHHLRDSGSLEQDAYQVVFIYQDPECGDDPYYDNVPTIVNIAANRGGPTGNINMRFKKTKQKFVLAESDIGD